MKETAFPRNITKNKLMCIYISPFKKIINWIQVGHC